MRWFQCPASNRSKYLSPAKTCLGIWCNLRVSFELTFSLANISLGQIFFSPTTLVTLLVAPQPDLLLFEQKNPQRQILVACRFGIFFVLIHPLDRSCPKTRVLMNLSATLILYIMSISLKVHKLSIIFM
jgi:hypothetical protein